MNLDRLAAGGLTHVTIGGKSYLVGELTPYLLGRLLGKVRDHLPHPLKRLRDSGALEGLPDSVVADLVAREMPKRGEWPPDLADKVAQTWLTTEGLPHYLEVILGARNPGLDHAEAIRVAAAMSNAELEALTVATRGADDGPKSTTTGAPTNP